MDENDLSIFDNKPASSNNALDFIQKPKMPEKKPQPLLGMEFKPLEKSMEAYKIPNTPNNAPKYDPRKIKR